MTATATAGREVAKVRKRDRPVDPADVPAPPHCPPWCLHALAGDPHPWGWLSRLGKRGVEGSRNCEQLIWADRGWRVARHRLVQLDTVNEPAQVADDIRLSWPGLDGRLIGLSPTESRALGRALIAAANAVAGEVTE